MEFILFIEFVLVLGFWVYLKKNKKEIKIVDQKKLP